MSQCQYGSRDGFAQDECFVLVNPTLLALNTIQLIVVCQVFYFQLRWWKGRIASLSLVLQIMVPSGEGLLHMLKSIFNLGHYVAIDRGFCVLKAMI